MVQHMIPARTTVRLSRVRGSSFVPDPGALNSRMPTFPETIVGFTMVTVLLPLSLRGGLGRRGPSGRGARPDRTCSGGPGDVV